MKTAQTIHKLIKNEWIDNISVFWAAWRMVGKGHCDTWLLIMFIIDFFLYTNILSMGAWGNDISFSDVDLSQNKVTSLLWYKIFQSHGVLL